MSLYLGFKNHATAQIQRVCQNEHNGKAGRRTQNQQNRHWFADGKPDRKPVLFRHIKRNLTGDAKLSQKV